MAQKPIILTQFVAPLGHEKKADIIIEFLKLVTASHTLAPVGGATASRLRGSCSQIVAKPRHPLGLAARPRACRQSTRAVSF